MNLVGETNRHKMKELVLFTIQQLIFGIRMKAEACKNIYR